MNLEPIGDLDEENLSPEMRLIWNAIDKGGGQSTDIRGVIRELQKIGYLTGAAVFDFVADSGTTYRCRVDSLTGISVKKVT